MTFKEEWVATAARIAALKDDAQLRAQQARTHDRWGIGPRLANESRHCSSGGQRASPA